MKTCLHMTATYWPATRVPMTVGARYSLPVAGYNVSREPSLTSIGKKTNGNVDGPGVSR